MADTDWAEEADAQEILSKQVEELKVKELTPVQATVQVNPTETEDDEKPLTSAERSWLQKHLRQSLVRNEQKLEIQQQDPNSPLYSARTFEELNLRPQLKSGIYQMGFNHPSKIQATALPMLLDDPPQNMIAQSQSGTGKTAAFVLTMLSRVSLSDKYPQCICLSPTFELALQTGKTIEEMGKNLEGLSVAYAVRHNKVQRGTLIPSQIIIGTPGTMLDWCIKKKVVDMKRIKVFVLDEADVMIDTQGFKDMSIKLKNQLDQDSCQVLLFSATYDPKVMSFAKSVVRRPNIIKLRRDEETLDNIKQYYVKCNSPEAKYEALNNLMTVITVGQGMIFCHTKKTASWLAAKMKEERYIVALLSGDLESVERAQVLKRFKSGKERWLVTTNVCSRGIDIEQMSLVVNFDLPVSFAGRADCETYLHRIGRTGRFGKSGVAINFVTTENDMRILHDIETHFNKKIICLNDTEDYDEMKTKIHGQESGDW